MDMSIHTRTGVLGFACVVALLAFGMRVPAAHGEDMAFEFNVDGVLPSSQGAVFNGNPAGYLETDFFSVSGGLLRQDTTRWGYINANYGVPGVFDHSQDAVLEFRAKLIESTYWYRGGVSGLLFSGDRFWEIALSDNSIFCCNDEIPFNPRDDFHVYRMVIPANQDEYQVYVDGQLVYTGLAGSFSWYEGLLMWGDASEGNAVVEWDYVRLANHAPDTTPPVISVAVSPPVLWPPSGQMVAVTISGSVADGQSGLDLASAYFVVLDEYCRVQPAGIVPVQADGQYEVTFFLEASRGGRDGDGRLYTVTIRASDLVGNQGTMSVAVAVPFNQRS